MSPQVFRQGHSPYQLKASGFKAPAALNGSSNASQELHPRKVLQHNPNTTPTWNPAFLTEFHHEHPSTLGVQVIAVYTQTNLEPQSVIHQFSHRGRGRALGALGIHPAPIVDTRLWAVDNPLAESKAEGSSSGVLGGLPKTNVVELRHT